MEAFKNFLTDLAQSPQIWTAGVGLVNALQRWLVPGIPNDVMLGVNGVIIAIAVVVTGKQVVQARAFRTARILNE